MRLRELLEKQFVQFYGISTKDITVDSIISQEKEFDLDDMSSPIHTVPVGEGKLTIKDNDTSLEIVHYEDFINQCKKPQSFARGRKRCDYIICSNIDDVSSGGHIILAELTSALGDRDHLLIPIKDSDGNVVFSDGKIGKATLQLEESLHTLMSVPEISDMFKSMTDKQCVMAYKLIRYNNKVKRLEHPMNRYLSIESNETRNNGAIIPHDGINRFGFLYRRICQPAFLSFGNYVHMY